MTLFCFLFAAGALLLTVYAITVVRNTKKQISAMLDALADIKNGNGNRRILANTHDMAAPIAFEINEIILSYEKELSRLRQSKQNAQQLMTSLSHDVRTPLTTLIGYLDAAQNRVVTGQERDDYIAIARRKSHDLKDYMDVLFDWFRLHSDEFVIQLDTVEAAELTRNLLIDWIPIFEEKTVAYDILIPEQPFPAKLDPDGYARILNNLIQNALTHSRADNIQISLYKLEHHIKIQVADNGVGIKAEDLKHIFERLYQCEHPQSGKSSGLGLSIAAQLTEKMNGKLTAESAPGKGALFTLTFPLAAE